MPWSTGAYKRADPLHHLPAEALAALASLLCCPSSSDEDTQPPRDWLGEQRTCIQSLPRNLKLHRTLSLATFFTVDDVMSGRLCQSHHELKPELIFWCYARLDDEVSAHMDRYRLYRKDFPLECTDELRAYIDRVTAIATLSLSRDSFDAEYGRNALSDDQRYQRVRSRCAACVLSMVGARAQMLVDLRAGMLARMKARTPRFLPLVEAWMDGFHEQALGMRLESEELAEELKEFRGRIIKLKGKARPHGTKLHEERSRDRRRRRHRKQNGPSWSVALTQLFGLTSDKKKAKKEKKERRPEGDGKERSARHGSSSHHSSSAHRGPSRQSSSFPRSDSHHPSHPSWQGPGSSSGHGNQSKHDRDSSRPSSSALGAYEDGRSSPYSYYDPSYVDAGNEDIIDIAGHGSSRSTVSPESSPRMSSAHSDVSSLSSSPPTRWSRNPYRQSFTPAHPKGSTDSMDTIGAGTAAKPPRGRDLHHVFDPTPGDPRYSWTSRVASSVYSTDDNGLRPRENGFRASPSGHAVARVEPELHRVLEELGLDEEDVPMNPEEYDEVCCPSSDSEDEEEEKEEEEEAVEQYVPARARWGMDKGKEKEVRASAHVLCPVCRGDLSELTQEQANSHVDACLAGSSAPQPVRSGRPTVSGINRMVDEVIDGYGGLEIIDEAAAQFTPRPSVAARVRRDYDERRATAQPGYGASSSRDSPYGSVHDRSERRQSKLGGGKFKHVVRDR